MEQKIVPKNMVGRGEDAAENKKNFFISIAFFCGFHSDSVRRTTVCTGVGAAEADSCRQNGGRNDGYIRASGFGNRHRSRSG